MPTTDVDDWAAKPFAQWLEQKIQELMKANPVAIAMELVDENGLVGTCYYNTSANDRACMIDAMRDDARWEWVRENREEIVAVLNDEGGEDGELEGTDTKAD